ncbi:hypothetical protein [Candidatus Marinarcus aquaticus]|uniref:VCBS repeat-containing protein n=1 Tax=Candidatus Marinarcus aquaticus TaxID=2044504 RepID=A0A4Q0XTV1_9BACT|nr:hypothetical protein [Candidatus Marinarcus aquaticus]RXJ57593.1 hypothetical protein CRV04_07210 [Candidatus Marinarcus aquaticus]
MKIESSQVNMQTSTQSQMEIHSEQAMTFLHEVLGLAYDNNPKNKNKETFEVVDETANLLELQQNESNLSARELMMKIMLELILQRLLGGKSIKMYPKNEESVACSCNQTPVNQQKSLKIAVYHKVEIERTIEYSKKQSIDFSTQATVKTADKEITVDLELSFSQEFYERHKESLHFEEISFIDPLVIQYDQSCHAFDMIDEKITFMFDINSDESCEEIPLLKDGNGFLVLDKNDNGMIDNGNEMFGPNTNDGFSELAAYDEDGNNWIDENDSIFDQLRIWTKTSENEDQLLALGQVGIGALYLTPSEANITIDKSVNESLAHLKSNSIYLKEDGTAGVISALDFIA